MSRFIRLIDGENINAQKGTVIKPGQLKVNFKDILAAAFTDILEKKSSLFRSMVKKGVIINFEKSFEFPENNISGEISELINNFNEDMK